MTLHPQRLRLATARSPAGPCSPRAQCRAAGTCAVTPGAPREHTGRPRHTHLSLPQVPLPVQATWEASAWCDPRVLHEPGGLGQGPRWEDRVYRGAPWLLCSASGSSATLASPPPGLSHSLPTKSADQGLLLRNNRPSCLGPDMGHGTWPRGFFFACQLQNSHFPVANTRTPLSHQLLNNTGWMEVGGHLLPSEAPRPPFSPLSRTPKKAGLIRVGT